jgi:DNA-binding response OmpR family regulator
MNTAAQDPEEARGRSGPGSPLILLVEDDPQVRQFAAEALREEGGFDVAEASDGTSALAILSRLIPPPDLVIMDVQMPGMDGRTLGREIGHHWPTVPLLYMTGYDSGPSRGLTPLQPLLQKPFRADSLVGLVRALLRPAA